MLGALFGTPADGGPPWLLLVNGGRDDADMQLPEGRWRLVLDSAVGVVVSQGGDTATPPLAGRCPLPAHGVVLLRRLDR